VKFTPAAILTGRAAVLRTARQTSLRQRRQEQSYLTIDASGEQAESQRRPDDMRDRDGRDSKSRIDPHRKHASAGFDFHETAA
jgi:hypothetical protein